MFKLLLFFFIIITPLFSFESSNLQLLYSKNFTGDAFIYDTIDGEKTTLTFEHYRTFSYGDLYLFLDITDGKKFSGNTIELYSEIAPRFSLSKISGSDLSIGFIQDIYIATQINAAQDYRALLAGVGIDINIIGFNFANINAYYKDENIYTDASLQVTAVYQTKSLYNIHLEGFIDITTKDINTQNQLLYNFNTFLKTKEEILVGTEWLYYRYNYESKKSQTSVFQAMIKYKF